jgi:hypothetical protein
VWDQRVRFFSSEECSETASVGVGTVTTTTDAVRRFGGGTAGTSGGGRAINEGDRTRRIRIRRGRIPEIEQIILLRVGVRHASAGRRRPARRRSRLAEMGRQTRRVGVVRRSRATDTEVGRRARVVPVRVSVSMGSVRLVFDPRRRHRFRYSQPQAVLILPLPIPVRRRSRRLARHAVRGGATGVILLFFLLLLGFLGFFELFIPPLTISLGLLGVERRELAVDPVAFFYVFL